MDERGIVGLSSRGLTTVMPPPAHPHTCTHTGVTSKDGKKWEAKITENGRTKYLGFFNSELEGALLCALLDIVVGLVVLGPQPPRGP